MFITPQRYDAAAGTMRGCLHKTMIPDYELHAVPGGDEVFEWHRGRRTRTGAPVLVKLARATPARPAEAAALQREAAIAAELTSAATLLPRLLESRDHTALVMEDPGGVLLTSLLSAGRPALETVLATAIQLASTLAELHGRGVVHHGIRPDAVLCDESNSKAWLIDFGDACPASSGAPSALSAARLVYASPEQTGRLDRAADHRSDLYALGVLLYELLCAAPPFRSAHALELIHWHIAGVPTEPMQIDPTIPAPLSAIVMKLLAKSPDERYQTAAGLARDLDHCEREWSAQRRIATFALGQRDASAQLVISARLYGREHEVQTLLDAFDRCRGAGRGEMLLVEGYAGIGKTALIQQLVRPIVRHQGYFISGKFDQVMRGVPYGALIQAFGGLVRQLLTENEAQLAAWRDTLAQALGNNGGVLAEVIPEIEFIVGPQAAPTVLGSIEAQNRFQRVLQNFFAALAQPAHPLVLFLDDLQWADAATLALLEPLLTGGESRCLLLIGAYRDNELETAPRLVRTLAALESAGVAPQRVALGPLQPQDLAQLVADTLRCGPEQAEPLAALVHHKTGGNPFFVIQFLKALERDGHLRFDAEAARWTWRIEEIADAPLADNVIDLMTRSIQRLPPKSQYALTLAACIGNRFDQRTLAIVSEQTPAQTADDLAQAIAEGLIVNVSQATHRADPDDGDAAASYMFLHDRVQQAAYALIPEERRRMVHLTVGRLLNARASREQLDGFDVVHHLNLGRELITAPDEQLEVARLNLAAGRRAKSSTAHDTALDLLQAGIELLPPKAWDADYELCFALHLEAAECQYLCGRFDAAQERFGLLLGRARSAIDRARVVRLRSVQYENMAHYADAIALAREGLALFGVSFPDPEDAKLLALDREIERIESLRGARDIAALVELPAMTDPEVIIVLNMLTDIWSSAFIVGDPTLARLISATMVRLSLEHGNAPESAYGYVTHAITVGPMRGAYAQAYEYGRLALAVNQRFDDSRRRAKIYQQFHAHVALWCQPFESCIAYAREACQSGLNSGDFLYAAYGAGTEPWAAMVATQDLAQFERDYAPSVALIEKLKNRGFADQVRVLVNWSRALQGRTHAPMSLSDASFDEDAYLERYRENPFFTTIHAIARLQLCSLLGSPADALAAARHAGASVHHVPGTIWPVVFDFWNALALAANCDDATPSERSEWLGECRRAQARFEALALHCPQNFRCSALLLAAEIARIEARDRDAIERFTQAIEDAASEPLLPTLALAHERCGRCHADRGRAALARLHLVQAQACYARWGASAKVEAMLQQYRDWMPIDKATPSASTPSEDKVAARPAGGADELDLFSVMKAAQAIAAEVELDALLGRMMRIAIENAGAERGALVLESADGAIVHAVDAQGAATTAVALEQSDRVPAGIVNYVRRTAQSVVLAQAEADERHGTELYITRHKPRSVICVPVQKQGRSIGVLYLENTRVGGAFTADRIRILQMLATQAAISLENARLFARQKEEIAERERTETRLSQALAEVERLRVDLEAENSVLRRDLIANVSHDLRTPLVSIRGYLEVLAAKGDKLAPDQRRSYIDTAVRQSEHLGTLIDELFELAKLDFKGMALNREAFQFAELATDVMQKFQLVADSHEVALQVHAPAGLPRVNADLSLIERVLDNLIGNALKHTHSGGRVTVSLMAAADCVAVSVADTGAGIPQADLPFIFDRFYRAEGERRSSGAGLGLAIAKRILELHGSEIEVESDTRSGTRFRFTLPIHDAP